jgi:hypothetical protein
VVGRSEVDLPVVEEAAGPDAVLVDDRVVEAELLGQDGELLRRALAVEVTQGLRRVGGTLEEQHEHTHGRQNDDQER